MYKLGMLVAILLGAAVGLALAAGYTVAFGQESYGSCSTVGDVSPSSDAAGFYRCNGSTWQWVNGAGEHGYGICSIEDEAAKSSDSNGHYVCKSGSWTWINEKYPSQSPLQDAVFGSIVFWIGAAAIAGTGIFLVGWIIVESVSKTLRHIMEQ